MSMDVMLPVNGHLFSADALQKYAKEATDAHPGKSNILKGAVDSTGAHVVLVIGTNDGNLKIETAYAHDWQGNNTFGVGGSFAW